MLDVFYKTLAVMITLTIFGVNSQASASTLAELLADLLSAARKPASAPTPIPTPTPAPSACSTQTYNVTLDARNNVAWPYRSRCDGNDFHRWFAGEHINSWLGRSIVLEHLPSQLDQANLQHETLVVDAVVLDFENLDADHLRISMNGLKGMAIKSNAISIQTIDNHAFLLPINFLESEIIFGELRKLGHERDLLRAVRSIKHVQITIHLEDFVFGANQSAASILRKSADGSSKVRFKIHGAGDVFPHYFNGELQLQGTVTKGNCGNPTPTPVPTVNPTPAATPTPLPTVPPTPTPLPAPVATITNTSVSGLTNNNSAQVSFTANESSTFLCSLDGSAFSSCSSPASMNSLADGAHDFAVEAVNTQGTMGAAVHFDWTVDTTAPVASFGTITPSGSETAQTQIIINFSANEPSSFQCALDGASSGACNSPATFSNLGNGSHSFTVTPTDLAGNVGVTLTYSWTVKTTPPQINITSVVPSSNPSNSTTRTFGFSATADAASYLCSLDNQTAVACTSPYSVTGLADGAHQFAVRAVDAVGNQSQPATSAFTIDTIAPTLAITSTVPSQALTNQTTMQIGFMADASATFTCTLDGVASSCVSPVSYSNLSEGNHQFSVSATDQAGNVSASSASYSWTIDITPPVLTLMSVNPSTSVINQTQISLQFSANEPSHISCSLDSAAAQDCSSGSVNYANLADGAHMIILSATDLAGNVGQAVSYNFSVDTSTPVVQLLSEIPAQNLTNQNNFAIYFTASDAVSFTCQLDGGIAVPCTSPQSYSGLVDGTHTVSINAMNAAGTSTVAPATYTWTIDTTPPTTQLVSESPNESTTSSTSEVIAFTASESSTFMCSLDGAALSACTSPMSYDGLSDGAHTFAVFATDLAGNTDPMGASYSWTIDTQPLVISNVQIINLSQTSATFVWATNKPSSSTVFYAAFPPSTYLSVTDSTLTTSHSVTVTGLTAFTVYSYYVSSTDDANNTATNLPANTFRTLR